MHFCELAARTSLASGDVGSTCTRVGGRAVLAEGGRVARRRKRSAIKWGPVRGTGCGGGRALGMRRGRATKSGAVGPRGAADARWALVKPPLACPTKIGLNWFMPALVKRSVGSSRGTTAEESTVVCSRSEKNSRKV
jgi:hypothetical protein